MCMYFGFECVTLARKLVITFIYPVSDNTSQYYFRSKVAIIFIEYMYYIICTYIFF